MDTPRRCWPREGGPGDGDRSSDDCLGYVADRVSLCDALPSAVEVEPLARCFAGGATISLGRRPLRILDGGAPSVPSASSLEAPRRVRWLRADRGVSETSESLSRECACGFGDDRGELLDAWEAGRC